MLIGINDYSPNSVRYIRPLQACLNDVANVNAFLKVHYGDLITDEGQILEITNAQATRENVINGFKNHLTQAKEGDVALVFYSGHGSYGVTAHEFQKFSTDQQEQTWVLYDSRESGKYDLADKEIALLLEKVGQRKPHLVVIADSCHSGSITRDVAEFQQMQPRFTSGTTEPRPLKTYLDGAYTQRPDLIIPNTNHLLIAACDRKERAWEADGHGQFTKALLNVLEKNGGQIQYADLFVQVRAAIKSETPNQTPQLETIGSVSARQGFLGRKVSAGLLSRYRVHFEGGKWLIDIGTGMGLDQSVMNQNPEIQLFESVVDGVLVGKGRLTAINITTSTLEITEGEPEEEKTYWGEPTNLSIKPFYVYADQEVTSLVQAAFDAVKESGLILSREAKACRFKLVLENNTLHIVDFTAQIRVQGVEGTTLESAQQLVEVLQSLARWNRLLELQNPDTELDESKLDFVLKVKKGSEEYLCSDAVVTLEYDAKPISFEAFFANNTHQSLYVALLHQSRNYGIQVLKNDSQAIEADTALTLVKNTFTLNPKNNEEIDTLKLLISTDLIDSSLLSQKDLVLGKVWKAGGNDKGLGSTRGINELPQSDWLTKTITVRIVRKGKEIAGEMPIVVGKGIEIQTHSSFRGNVNWASLLPKTRSVTELAIQNEYFLTNPYYQLVSLEEGTKGTDDKHILEIGDIQNSTILQNEPLVVTVKPQEGDDITLPLFFDGQDFLPLGKATLDEHGNFRFEITQIPDEKGEAKTRSLGSALRMVFVKFANKIGLGGETQLLRWVDYEDDAKRKSEDLEKKIAEANKVLLLVHGIIGDTEEMAKTFRIARDKGYDLVLTYDYENLNTPIEENARILKEKLLKAGFGKVDGKELVLVVHSMGGLVSRYMIERLGGDEFVDKLIMAGTPNGGSKFGDVPGYVNWASVLLGLGTKIFPPQIGAVTGFLSGFLKGTNAVLFKALSQMSSDDEFIKGLNAGNPPPISYVVFGGDLNTYLTANDGIALMEKAVAQIGGWVYKNEKNDIAVSIENIFKVGTTAKQELPCHHLNYFAVSDSIKALKEAL